MNCLRRTDSKAWLVGLLSVSFVLHDSFRVYDGRSIRLFDAKYHFSDTLLMRPLTRGLVRLDGAEDLLCLDVSVRFRQLVAMLGVVIDLTLERLNYS